MENQNQLSSESTESPSPAHGKGFKRHPLAIAWDEWMDTPEGLKCAAGSASGIYLENRLREAFMAGAEAGEKNAAH